MLNTLHQLKDTQKLCEIFAKTDTDLFYQGYITAIDDQYAVIAYVSNEGFADGFTMFRLENLNHLEYSTDFDLRIDRLYHLRNQKHSNLHFKNNIDIFDQVLQFSKDDHRIICLFLSEDNDFPIKGYVEDYDENMITVKCFDTSGNADGISIVEKDMIFDVEFDTLYTTSIELLICDLKDSR